MDHPLKWFQQNVLNRVTGTAPAKGGTIVPKGGAIVPTGGAIVPTAPGIQQITTNLKVPGGAVPGGGLGVMGARGMNGGVIDGAMDNIAGEAVRGALVVTGQDTAGFDKMRAGKPVVKNVGGKSFNVATPEGQRGYKKALEAGEKKSTPKTFPVTPPSPRTTPAPDSGDGVGTNTGFTGAGFEEANKLLKKGGVAGVGYGDFESNSLFTGDTNTVQGIDTSDPSFDPGYTKETPSFAPTDGFKSPFNQEFEAQLPKGGGYAVTDAVIPEAAASYGFKQSGATGKLGTKERYRSEMFNNGDTSLMGLRAAEASKGLLYASGKYWQANPNAGQEGQKDFLAISNDDAKAIKSGNMNAQDFLASKISAVKEDDEDDLITSTEVSPTDTL